MTHNQQESYESRKARIAELEREYAAKLEQLRPDAGAELRYAVDELRRIAACSSNVRIDEHVNTLVRAINQAGR
jgi:hypothetical protein